MTTTSTTTLDLDAIGRAVVERDAAARLAHYADDAVVEVVDSEHPPSNPQRFRGRDAIRDYVEDIAARDMTHTIRSALAAGDQAAVVIDCQYADGTRVRCSGLLEGRDGKIVREEVVQAWDS
jgi:ketosteroid isomerase-like protein